MSAQRQTLSQWVEQLNDTLFIQPNDELAVRAVHEQVDPSLVVKINHSIYNYDQFKIGLQHVRSASTSLQGTFSVILQWENPKNPENSDGVVAVLSKWATKDKKTGEEIKKTNVILWEVKLVDGERKLTGQTEVEAT